MQCFKVKVKNTIARCHSIASCYSIARCYTFAKFNTIAIFYAIAKFYTFTWLYSNCKFDTIPRFYILLDLQLQGLNIIARFNVKSKPSRKWSPTSSTTLVTMVTKPGYHGNEMFQIIYRLSQPCFDKSETQNLGKVKILAVFNSATPTLLYLSRIYRLS